MELDLLTAHLAQITRHCEDAYPDEGCGILVGHIQDGRRIVVDLLLTDNGLIKLVDINNISRVDFGNTIQVDDKGYPVCDKSVEALSQLQIKMASQQLDPADRLYRTYLDPDRMSAVQDIEREFHRESILRQYRAG